MKELMFMDYIRYLQRTKVIQEQKINERMVSVLDILVELKKLRSSNFLENQNIKGIYTKKSYHTVRRDFDLPQLFGPLFKLVNSSIYSLLYYPLALRPNPVV